MYVLLIHYNSGIFTLTRSDWRSAERFWEFKESWSYFRKLREAFRIDHALVKSHHWLTSPQDLKYRKYILSQAMHNVKAFRRQIKGGELTFETISERRTSVYGRYAYAMNGLESWTSEF